MENENENPDPVGESTIEENDYDTKLKIMCIGDSTVGKTSILRRYCKNEFSDKYATTIGIDFQIKNMIINNKRIRIQIWDTAGQERYRVIAKNYFNSSDGFVVIYDITNRNSFNNINNWISQINDIAVKTVKFVLFGNKCDLEKNRIVGENEGAEAAKTYSVPFYETSAKTGVNVNDGFEYLIHEILASENINNRLSKRSEVLSRNKPIKSEAKKSGCC